MNLKSRLIGAAAALALNATLTGSAGSVPGEIIGTPRVLDGDTIEIRGVRVRLHGIDAPESSQTCAAPNDPAWACGHDATRHLQALIGTAPVTCTPEQAARDRYGRIIAACRNKDGTDLGRAMVQRGMAWAFRKYSLRYVDDEVAARREGIGVWAMPNVTPSDFRHRHEH